MRLVWIRTTYPTETEKHNLIKVVGNSYNYTLGPFYDTIIAPIIHFGYYKRQDPLHIFAYFLMLILNAGHKTYGLLTASNKK